MSKMPAAIRHFCCEVPQFVYGENNFPHCASLPISAVRKPGVFPQVLTLSTNGGTKYRVSACRFKQYTTLLCIHPLLTESRDRTNLISVLRFLSKIMIYYVRIHLTALLPLCYQSYSNSGTEIFFFYLF